MSLERWDDGYWMFKDEKGKWVKYEDVKKLEELNREMHKVIEQLVCMTFNDEQLRELITEAHKILKKARGEGE